MPSESSERFAEELREESSSVAREQLAEKRINSATDSQQIDSIAGTLLEYRMTGDRLKNLILTKLSALKVQLDTSSQLKRLRELLAPTDAQKLSQQAGAAIEQTTSVVSSAFKKFQDVALKPLAGALGSIPIVGPLAGIVSGFHPTQLARAAEVKMYEFLVDPEGIFGEKFLKTWYGKLLVGPINAAKKRLLQLALYQVAEESKSDEHRSVGETVVPEVRVDSVHLKSLLAKSPEDIKDLARQQIARCRSSGTITIVLNINTLLGSPVTIAHEKPRGIDATTEQTLLATDACKKAGITKVTLGTEKTSTLRMKDRQLTLAGVDLQADGCLSPRLQKFLEVAANVTNSNIHQMTLDDTSPLAIEVISGTLSVPSTVAVGIAQRFSQIPFRQDGNRFTSIVYGVVGMPLDQSLVRLHRNGVTETLAINAREETIKVCSDPGYWQSLMNTILGASLSASGAHQDYQHTSNTWVPCTQTTKAAAPTPA